MRQKQGRIVLVDEDEAARKDLGRILGENGFEVVLASDGEDALRQVVEKAPDIVLTDLRLPGLDSYELLTRVKKGFPDVAVVIVTASGTIRGAVRALRQGAEDYLTKPIEVDEVKQVLDRIVKRKGLATETQLPRERLDEKTRRGVTVPGARLEDIERDAILKTLEASGGSTIRAARILNISPRTIQYKLKKYRSESPVADSRRESARRTE